MKQYTLILIIGGVAVAVGIALWYLSTTTKVSPGAGSGGISGTGGYTGGPCPPGYIESDGQCFPSGSSVGTTTGINTGIPGHIIDTGPVTYNPNGQCLTCNGGTNVNYNPTVGTAQAISSDIVPNPKSLLSNSQSKVPGYLGGLRVPTSQAYMG